MEFELLSNEILIEYFEYLSIFDIFHSFDQLNYRFYKLLRTIPIHLNFQNVRKTKLFQFCRQKLSNSKIQQQIYSLGLSNKDAYGPIKAFLSRFPLNKFSNLHSLTLTQIEDENIAQLKSMLPISSKLYAFHLISSHYDEDEIISVLPMSNLRRLSLLTLRSFLIHI
ncbi:unnamed protein product [Rotaria sp. Silwood2]|nr:unnamed protein product [Rotaria sp. Silwood2]